MKNKIKRFIDTIIQRNFKTAEKPLIEYEELLEEVPPVYPFSSIIEVMEIFKHFETPALPVIGIDGFVIGTINHRDITHLIALQSLVSWSALKNYSVDSLIVNSTNVVKRNTTLEEITVEFTGKNTDIIPIVNDDETYSGYCITAPRLIKFTSNTIKPRSIGGLATPLGVYLTDGVYNTGAGSVGLFLTGLLFGVLINVLSILAIVFLYPFNIPDTLLLVIELSVFLLLLRLSPLAGYHAAEHQTIHAIEKGIELTTENVQKQPKEHERCGTNIMILVLGLSLILMISMDYLGNIGVVTQTFILVLLSVLLLSNWKKLGHKLQKFFTTAKATDKQIASGIKAGQQLLELYKDNTMPPKITPWLKIWNMGLLQVLATFIMVSILFQYLIAYLWPSLFKYATIIL
jgi:CBS domain-containing protein